jgi:hypothetical protein
MSIVVIGGDSLGSIEKNLYAMGVTELVHISGRKVSDRKNITLPSTTAFVLVLTDFINHNIVKSVKNVAKSQSIPMIFSKRSWRFVEEKLTAEGIGGRLAVGCVK